MSGVSEPAVDAPRRGSGLLAVGLVLLIAVLAAGATVAWARVDARRAAADPVAEVPTTLADGSTPAPVPSEIADAVDVAVIGAIRLDAAPPGLEACHREQAELGDVRVRAAYITPAAAVVTGEGRGDAFGAAPALPLPPPEAPAVAGTADEPAGSEPLASEAVASEPEVPEPEVLEPPQQRLLVSCTGRFVSGGWQQTGEMIAPLDDGAFGGGMSFDGTLASSTVTVDGAAWLLHLVDGYAVAYDVAGLEVAPVVWSSGDGGLFGGGFPGSTSALLLDAGGGVLEEVRVG